MKVKVITEFRVSCPKCKAEIMFEPSEVQKETAMLHVHERSNFVKASRTKEKTYEYIECPMCHEKIHLYYDHNVAGHVVSIAEKWIDVEYLNNDRNNKDN